MMLRKNAHKIILLVKMLVGTNKDLQCFRFKLTIPSLPTCYRNLPLIRS